MSNSKRFLSIILAMIMACSMLVVGANAAYTQYKDSAIIGQYNGLDKPVLTSAQYASAALDEVDRMLNKEQINMNVYVGTLDATSVDAAMESVYTLVNGSAFDLAGSMLGDLGNLNADAFASVRRTSSGKTDLDVIYAVLQFLYDNKGLIVSYINQTINLGTILPSVVDLSDYTDVNKLLKGLLYEAAYNEDAPSDVSGISIDTMVQDLIDTNVITAVPELEGYTNISTGSMYNFIDNALKQLYNSLLVDLLNDNVKYEINKFCGVVYTKDSQGNITNVDKSNLNSYANLLNIDYTIPQYTFTSGTFIENINGIIKSILDEMLADGVYTWVGGSNTNISSNITGLAKAIITNTGDDFFASYIKLATPEEVNAMSTEELCVYALRAIINGSVHGMYIPESATTIREFGYYALSQLLATAVPELDFSSFDKNSTDTLVIMGVNYAIYNVNAVIDMGLTYVDTMDGVDQQIKTAVDYAIDNYSGILGGISFNSTATGWANLNKLVFSIINSNWLPTAANSDLKTLIIDCLIDNILDLDFDAFLSMLSFRSDSELQSSPKQVVLNTVRRVVNTIFPGAIAQASTIDALATNSALANTVNSIFTNLYTNRVNLVADILPTLCDVLSLTSPQEFKFPDLTYDDMIYDNSGSPDFTINMRNSSSGINTGYKNINGTFTQDSLYTYDIQSVTSNVPSLTIDYPRELSGGQEGAIRVHGSCSDTVFILTITYDVLTEDGTTLTNEPITEYVYSYIATSSSSDLDTTFTSTSGSFSLTAPSTIYASSMSDLYKMQFEVTNSSDTTYNNLLPTSTLPTAILTAAYTSEPDEDGNTVTVPAGKAYLQLKTDPSTLIKKNGDTPGTASIYAVETTDEYNALTAAEKDATWDAIILKGTNTRYNGRFVVNNGITVNGTAITKSNQVAWLYNDYNLGSMLKAELGKHRQPSGYSSTAAWTRYTTALQQAANAVYSPFKTTTFGSISATNKGKVTLYKPAYTELKAAIEALDETAISQGVSSTQAIIDSINPSNENLEYDDSSYSFFGMADFAPHTYYNYKDEYSTASDMINAATIPDETTGETQIVSDLTIAYNNHRLSLYGGRLLPVVANKQHLAAELANATSFVDTDYSAESWANFQRALTFATSVNNEAVGTASNPTLRQSKVNTAYGELLEAEKRLMPDEGSEDATFVPVCPDDSSITPIIEDTSDGLILRGVFGLNMFDAEDYFDCTGCHVEYINTSEDALGTGAIINIKSDADDSVLATYTLCVMGDLDGNADVDALDVTVLSGFVAGTSSPGPLQILAGDFSADSDIEALDISTYSEVVGGIRSVDFANNTAN